MILIDPRTGSKDILSYIESIPGHPPAELSHLEAGDVAFSGNGPQSPLAVGIEVKLLPDVLACITDQRFAGHQLPLLRQYYDLVYLAIEGQWRMNWQSGVLEWKRDREQRFWVPAATGRRQWLYHDFDAWLVSMEVAGGARVKRFMDRRELVQWVLDLYGWLQKPWTDHHTVGAIYSPPLTTDNGATPFVKPGLVQRVAAQLDGLGYDRSLKVARHFKTVREMAEAGEEEWRRALEIKDKKSKLAKGIVEALRGEMSEHK